MDIFALDLETEPLDKSIAEVAALEPWRVRQRKAKISSVAVSGPHGYFKQIVNNGSSYDPDFVREYTELLNFLRGRTVFAHYATFDVAWSIATMQEDKTGQVPAAIKEIKWRDTMLLAKWLVNGQKAEDIGFEFNLKFLIKSFIKHDEPGALPVAEFLEMKAESVAAGENPDYWLARGKSDTIYTRALAMFLIDKLPREQLRGYLTECSNIVPVANSWLIGLRVDKEKLDKLKPRIAVTRTRLAAKIGVATTVVSSPKQLANLLFNQWKMPVHSYTPSGSPSTAKDALMWIEYNLRLAGNIEAADRMKLVLQLKSFSTVESKYVKTMYEALSHTGDGYIYGAPKIFGTYTGRYTYSNATKKVFKTGIALHQMPRKAAYIRELLLPPPGHKLIELDASGQESRLMALRSGDENMLEIFRNGMNFHAMSGAAIIGMPYPTFMDLLKTDKMVYEYRQRGKLLNLAANFRIGAKSFSEQAFVKYEEFIDMATSNHMLSVFKRQYPGVPAYWTNVIRESKEAGYTEEFGGRRYKLSNWNEKSWVTESAALMFPIQGSGASMKNIAVHEMASKFSDVHFVLDLHDANFSVAPEDVAEERFKQMNEVLDNIDYSKYWTRPVTIPLPYEGGFGDNFGDVK